MSATNIQSAVFTTAVTKNNIKNEIISKVHEHIEKIVDALLENVDVETEVQQTVNGTEFIVISKVKMPKSEESDATS